MNLTSIHHIVIIVSDYNLSKDFYVDKLGFSIIRENYRPERNDWKLDLQCGNIELEIFGVSNPPTRVSNPEACGLRHLAFRVDDVKATVKELEKLEKEGLLEEEGDFVRLTSRGIDLSNPVLAEFLLS